MKIRKDKLLHVRITDHAKTMLDKFGKGNKSAAVIDFTEFIARVGVKNARRILSEGKK